jgi:hypothetical protein
LLRGVAFRRSHTQDAFSSGTGNLSVRVSTAAVTLEATNPIFSLNHGPDLSSCYAGPFLAPASPPPPGPAVAWTTANTVQLTFTNPFPYAGGNLCLELDGVIGANSPALWLADGANNSAAGTVTHYGTACGAYVDVDGRTASAEATTLIPGGTAMFTLMCTPLAPAWMVLAGSQSPFGMELSVYGLPGCYNHMSGLLATLLSFSPPAQTGMAFSMATAQVRIPTAPWVLGAQYQSQWIDWGQPATSNALSWMVSNNPTTLDVAVVRGFYENGQQPSAGEVIRDHALIVRLEFQ